MALDSFTISALKGELRTEILNTKINKIVQSENDELILSLRDNTRKKELRLYLTASSSFPCIYLINFNKNAPINAPNFCMLLRKHILNGVILDVIQPNFERVVRIKISSFNEMGDYVIRYLIIEMMGKYSNIILVDEEDVIIDSIKHISKNISSVREVLPTKKYFIPDIQNKINPLLLDNSYYDNFRNMILSSNCEIYKSIYESYRGISPVLASELSIRAGVSPDYMTQSLNESDIKEIFNQLLNLKKIISENRFTPIIYSDSRGNPVEFGVIRLEAYSVYDETSFSSVSDMLMNYFSSKLNADKVKQKSASMKQKISLLLNRAKKKLDIQEKQLNDTRKKDKYKKYGELINVYGYNIADDASFLIAYDYYDNNKELKIPLDNTLSVRENSQKYFNRYNKLKRTYEALNKLIPETKSEIEYLSFVLYFLNNASSEDELTGIRDELEENGILKKKGGRNKNKRSKKLEPLHYISSDGFDIYVGRNNLQNEELTSKAKNKDWWFHAKKIPGSHVILKNNKGIEIPDRTFEEAAMLAAFYSDAKNSDKAEIDYLEKKHIIKPPKSQTGYVIYHTNYSMVVSPNIDNIKRVN